MTTPSTTKPPITKYHDQTLIQPNVLTTAIYSLTRNQKRLLYLAVRNFKFTEGNLASLITYEQYANAFGFGEKEAAKITAEVRSADLSFLGGSSKKPVAVRNAVRMDLGNGDTDSIAFVQTLKYGTKRKSIEVKFGEDFAEIIRNTDLKFTKFLLSNVRNLKSPHSMRMVENVSQWRTSRNSLVRSVDWWLEKFGLVGKYKRQSDLKSKFFNVIKEEINENADFYFDYEFIFGNGKRKATSVKITWADKPKEAEREEQDAMAFEPTYEFAVATYEKILLGDLTVPMTVQELDNVEAFFVKLIGNGLVKDPMEFVTTLKFVRNTVIEREATIKAFAELDEAAKEFTEPTGSEDPSEKPSEDPSEKLSDDDLKALDELFEPLCDQNKK